jgi:riboflavin synthase alpha subunit
LQESGAGKPGHEISATVSLLVKTGFNIEAMTHTQLETKIGQPAESVSLAVAVQGQCLIAQFSSTWLTTKVADETASGCLIGDVEQASQLNN